MTFNPPGRHSGRGSSFLSESRSCGRRPFRSKRPASAIRSPETNGGGESASRLAGAGCHLEATGTGSALSLRPLRAAVGPMPSSVGHFLLGGVCLGQPLRTRERVPDRPALAALSVPTRPAPAPSFRKIQNPKSKIANPKSTTRSPRPLRAAVGPNRRTRSGKLRSAKT